METSQQVLGFFAMDLIIDAELIHYPQQGNMGLNFQGPKGQKVSSL